MSDILTKHFVTFYSPGTMFPEVTEQSIDEWDVREAFHRARAVVERYDSRPYAFQFSTRTRGPEDLDSKVSARSSYYFINGKIETREEIMARNDPKEEILRTNMECNNFAAVWTSCTPWRHTASLADEDVCLDSDGNVIER